MSIGKHRHLNADSGANPIMARWSLAPTAQRKTKKTLKQCRLAAKVVIQPFILRQKAQCFTPTLNLT